MITNINVLHCDLQDFEQGKSPYITLLVDFDQIHLPGDPSGRRQCCCCYHCGVSPAKRPKGDSEERKRGGGGWVTEC